MKRAHIKGELAEALFVGRNPEWGYVGRPNSPEVDVYHWPPGSRRPEGAQIKTHASGDPRVYARDMAVDSKADRFLVPDDHVQALRAHWQQEVDLARVSGDSTAEAVAKRQLGRVRGLGFTSHELDESFNRISSYCMRERAGRYTSIGASAAMTFGPSVVDFLRTGAISDASIRQVSGGVLLALGERGITYALTKVRGGSL